MELIYKLINTQSHTTLLYFTIAEFYEKIYTNAGDIFQDLRCYRDMDRFYKIKENLRIA